MTSTENAENDVRNRDAATHTPFEHHTASVSLSSSNHRNSFQSSDTGESSKAASARNSLTTSPNGDNVGEDGSFDVTPLKDGRGSHRSHRSRNSGGFLLSNPVFEPPSTVHQTTDHAPKRASTDHKGKAALRAPEKRHSKRRSGVGLGIGGSPLAANVTIVGTNGVGGDSTTDRIDGDDSTSATKPPGAPGPGFDVDSTQIVNLALNLSESRRAARRNVSSPLPPPTPSFGESFAGGSLRHHLQQQRKSSRNVSPKPDRGDRAVTASPRFTSGQKINSPLKPALELDQDGQYHYHFSASTLARAEKAKNLIELMAQYRRLLEYVPPLKPQALERHATANSAILESPIGVTRTSSTTAPVPRPLGREYNPLQYIRNRKVRARERRAIDGDAQGFGDVEKVSSWVDQVSQEASLEDSQTADCLSMPTFSKAADFAASPHNSPTSTFGKAHATQSKIKRPRVDWITNPADMIADIFWLEQDDNKKSIEDRHGRMIFSRSTELKRPVSRRADESESQGTSGSVIKREPARSPDLRIDTKLPEFRSVRVDSDKHVDMATSRARQKLREATRMHGQNGSIHHFLHARSHSRSDSNSSDSEAVSRPRRRRSGTTDSHDRGTDILEKQMMEMLASESRNGKWGSEDVQSDAIFDSIEPPNSGRKDNLVKAQNTLGHSKPGSITNKETSSRRGSFQNGSSGRASLEVPGSGARSSLEELDSTAPNSPQLKALKASNSFIPSIGMDLSPPSRSRQPSPTRNPLSRVKSRFNHYQGHNRDRSRSRVPEVETILMPLSTASNSKEPKPDSPVTPEKQKRSMSPVKKVNTVDSAKSSIRKGGGIRKTKTVEEAAGVRGLFKGSRNPVARVSDFIWKKEFSPIGPSSGFSTDESDVEDIRTVSEKKDSRNSSIAMQHSSDDVQIVSPPKEKPSYLGEMPTFTSPFPELRGRPTRARSDEASGSPVKEDRQAREERRKSSRAHMLKYPPRIDVQNASPTSSPDFPPQDRYQVDASVSDIDSRRGSFATEASGAEAGLDAILGIPGKRGNMPFASGLLKLEASNSHRLSSGGKRHWSISDRGVSVHRGPMTKQEIARVKVLLLSSGIKAKEIARRAAEAKGIRDTEERVYAEILPMAQQKIGPVPKSQQHILAARILADDIQLSSEMWQASADNFTGVTMQNLLTRIDALRGRVTDDLTPMTRKAADEADEVSKDLVTSQTLKVKRITDSMDKMMRQRRRRFRWLRRGGWLMVEWALVGVMWLVWFVVVFVRIIMAVGNGAVGVGRWLLFR
ncbi:hypothetical protein D0Z07_8744 [Hyphodiscus hymeniophilus]|uniref:Uncharacterized protein n=1 Tax=Hyphodiscus hymeniophilus TaxID=353542 RepID=A0A9P6SQU6_9HELO|nr:hypothetical protein D0Z07_8744 [Hyphodiscus hymeniophilus]